MVTVTAVIAEDDRPSGSNELPVLLVRDALEGVNGYVELSAGEAAGNDLVPV